MECTLHDRSAREGECACPLRRSGCNLKKSAVPIRKLDHLVITTPDPAACLAFYELLGFESRAAGARYELHAGDFKINVHMRGRELEPHAARIQPGSADLCFEIGGDLDEWMAEVSARGIEVALGIVDRTGVRGSMRSFYVRDPDGNLLEFCSYTQ